MLDIMHIYGKVNLPHICVTGPHCGGGTGTLDKLAGSHSRLAIYPTLTICYQRVVICASLDTRFQGRR